MINTNPAPHRAPLPWGQLQGLRRTLSCKRADPNWDLAPKRPAPPLGPGPRPALTAVNKNLGAMQSASARAQHSRMSTRARVARNSETAEPAERSRRERRTPGQWWQGTTEQPAGNAEGSVFC